MRYLLLLLTVSSFAQDFNYGNPNAVVSRSIENIDVSYKQVQYTDENIVINATVDHPVSHWTWEIKRTVDRQTVYTGTGEDPTPFLITKPGYYDIKLTASNSQDQYDRYIRRAFRVFKPKVGEGGADLVIDVSTSDIIFEDFTGEDWSDKVIFLKGTNSNCLVQFHNLRGSSGHPVIIEKADDNVKVEWSSRVGSGHTLWFSSNNSTDGCRYVVVNGFNADGTPGIKVNGKVGTTQLVYADGKYTNIELAGMEFTDITTVDAACVAFIPTVSSSNNINNWYTDSLFFYRIDITNAGEEGFYIGYNNQNAHPSGFTPPNGRGGFIAWCSVNGAGRDAYQFGGWLHFELHNCTANDWGLQLERGHRSAISHNAGSAGVVYQNYFYNGEMFYNLQSGPYPYDVRAGETVAEPTAVIGNVFANGTYSQMPNPVDREPFTMYGQNFFPGPNPGAAWNFYVMANTIDSDKKVMETNFANSSWIGTDWAFVNNVLIKLGNAGDYPELNFVGDAAGSVTGTTVNDIVRERGSDLSNLYFTDYAAHDFSISSLSSVVYSGAPEDLQANYSEWSDFFYDHLGFPLDVPGFGYTFGAFCGYNKRLLTPP